MCTGSNDGPNRMWDMVGQTFAVKSTCFKIGPTVWIIFAARVITDVKLRGVSAEWTWGAHLVSWPTWRKLSVGLKALRDIRGHHGQPTHEANPAGEHLR